MLHQLDYFVCSFENLLESLNEIVGGFRFLQEVFTVYLSLGESGVEHEHFGRLERLDNLILFLLGNDGLCFVEFAFEELEL
jgi:hypothetical protein